MDFVAPIITPIVESLLVPIKRHMTFLVSSSNYVKDMTAKMTLLDARASDMRTKQMDNKEKRLVVPHYVPKWLEEVEKIKVEIKEKIPTSAVGCFNMKMRYKIGQRSYHIHKDIVRLMNEETKITWGNERIPLGKVTTFRPSTSALVNDDNYSDTKNKSMSSRDLIFIAALKFLESNDNKTHMMALCGMGGVGKTTMMKQLMKAVEDKKMFDWIVKVVIGKDFNPIHIQQVIADYIDHPLTEKTKETRAESLQKRFEKMSNDGKMKILVILDDVWGEFNLNDIGLTSPLPNGFQLLLTSREETVCNDMGIEDSSIFRIEVLKEPEAKTLFWKIAGQFSEFDLQAIGVDIIKRCGGLPIAINTIACTLRGKEKYAWEDTLYRLQNKEFRVLDNIFEISCNNLKEDDKAIFLLSGLFPEDYNIHIEELLRYGWGLKIFKNVHTIEKARSRVKTCVNNLLCSNLLIKSDCDEYVKLHDLVRDYVLSNFLGVNQASIVNHDGNIYEQLKEDVSYERILLQCGSKFEGLVDFNHPTLKLLILMGGYIQDKTPKDFCARMEKLEVVTYVNMHRPVLPKYSTNIRALSLHSCSLIDDDISFLGDLLNLEVLTLANCGIHNLPSKIGNLKRLKLLDLTGCVSLSIGDGVFQNLEKLEELYISVFQSEDAKMNSIQFTDTNCDELKILSRKLSALKLEFFDNKANPKFVSFEKLEKFQISIGCLLPELRTFNNGLYSFKNTLKLVTSSMELLESKINELFRKTESLYLEVNDMVYLEDFSTYYPQHSFGNLKELIVSNCGSLRFLFTFPMAKGLINLQILEVSSCPVMKLVVYGVNKGDGEIRFNKLQRLSLKDLPELVRFCDVVNVMELPQLVELDLDKLHKFTSVFSKNNISISGSQLPFFNKEVEIPKLKKLKIHSMMNLKEIWPCEDMVNSIERDMLMTVREIKVTNCNNLVNIFPSNPMCLISHLEYLWVDKCDSIEVLFNIDLGKIEELTNNCNLRSNLRNINVNNLKSLRELWRIKGDENNYSSFVIHSFQDVESIDITGCGKFRNIVTPTTTKFKMRALKNININGCGNYYKKNKIVVNNDQEQEITRFQKEDVSEDGVLMSIVALPTNDMTLNFHNLRNVEIRNSHGVEVVFEIESSSNRDQLVTTQKQPLILHPYLTHLELKNMETLSRVWKCSNWNDFYSLHRFQPQSSFQNLTTIHLEHCKSIKYLFSPLMMKLLSNLHLVSILHCHEMEEVVSNQDDEHEEITHTTATFSPLIQLLELKYMSKLKHIGVVGAAKGTTNASLGQSKLFQVDVVPWSIGQYCGIIDIDRCHALSCVIPSYAAVGNIQRLQMLRINYCGSMTEVFETKGIINNNTSGFSTNNLDLESDTKVTIPCTRNITMHKLPYLKKLYIDNCKSLEYIFTFSTFESLKNLETLAITNCNSLKVIVREEDEEQRTKTTSIEMVFPHLKSIELSCLRNLEGFFLGMSIGFQFLLLDHVKINDCPHMVAFTSGKSTAPRLEYMQTELGKHNVECGDLRFHGTTVLHQTPSSCSDTVLKWRTWYFHNLIHYNLNDQYKNTTIFLSNELQQLQKLETIHARYCVDVEEVFELASEVTNNESQTGVKFPKLREVNLEGLKRLKYIWKSNQRRKLEFPNLTRLCISNCHSLEHVFTCSMVGCVRQLQELHVKWCEKMKLIVKEEENSDSKLSEIIEFPCLKILQLIGLPSLEGFSIGNEDVTFPSLDTLEIKDCLET